MTVAEALRRAIELASVSDSPRLDAELLLGHSANLSRTQLYTYPEKVLAPEVEAAFNQALDERIKGRPIAHIIGEREFWSLPIKVNDSTLIPRPDTEVLVEQAVSALAELKQPRILDLGTGTGAIALALAHEFPLSQIYALEASAEAVVLAKENAKALNKANVQILHGSWLDTDTQESLDGLAPFDMVVSNPPYIDEADPHLAEGDVRFEPISALVASENGLADIRIITQLSKQLLRCGGHLLIEHGWQQKDAVQAIFTQAKFQEVATVDDYGGNPRVTMGVIRDC